MAGNLGRIRRRLLPAGMNSAPDEILFFEIAISWQKKKYATI
jgi:hypothetical protein